jgi:hypothetical protein
VPRHCLVVLSSCISPLMPPKSKERKKVARVVPAKAKKREGFQSSSSSAMAGSSGAKLENRRRRDRDLSAAIRTASR